MIVYSQLRNKKTQMREILSCEHMIRKLNSHKNIKSLQENAIKLTCSLNV